MALAVALLALAAVAAFAAILSSGGDEQRPASGDRQEQQADRPRAEDEGSRPQQPAQQQPQEEQPAQEHQEPSGGGNDPAQGARLDAQAYRLIQQGKYEEAVPIARRAVESFPENDRSANYAYALYNLGTALNRSGRPKEAIPYLEKRLSFSDDRPDVVRAELNRARKAAGE